MQPTEINEFIKSVDEMIAMTASGKITWEKANPTTYVYDPTSKQGKVILQRVSTSGLPYVTFQVVLSNAVILEAHGTENRELNEKLKSLYSTVEKYRDIKGLNILKSILP